MECLSTIAIRSISFDYVLVAAKKNVPKSTVDRDEAFFI